MRRRRTKDYHIRIRSSTTSHTHVKGGRYTLKFHLYLWSLKSSKRYVADSSHKNTFNYFLVETFYILRNWWNPTFTESNNWSSTVPNFGVFIFPPGDGWNSGRLAQPTNARCAVLRNPSPPDFKFKPSSLYLLLSFTVQVGF